MNNSPCFFSTIIPCYNSNIVWLLHSINSVIDSLEKSEASGEIILVDDGSEVSIEASIRDRIQPTNIPIFFIRKMNGGLSSARNTGISHANGSYCHFLDDDDTISKDFYTYMANAISTSDSELLYCDSEFFDDHHRLPFDSTTEQQFIAKMICGNCVHVNAVVCKTDWLQEVNGFDESLPALEDWDIWIRMLRSQHRFEHLPIQLASVRLHQNSMSRDRRAMYSCMAQISIREMAEHSSFWITHLQTRKQINAWIKTAFTYSYRSKTPYKNVISCLRRSVHLDGTMSAIFFFIRQGVVALLTQENSPHQ